MLPTTTGDKTMNGSVIPSKVAFVAMPFGTKKTEVDVKSDAPKEVNFDRLWDLAYRPALEEAGYLPIRADEQDGALIIKDMITQLILADLVVADISIPNANVYYETGLRHGGSKQGCLLFAADWAKPVFDLEQVRRGTYALTGEDIKNEDYEKQRIQIYKAIANFDNTRNPLRELLDDHVIEAGESKRLTEVRDAVVQFQIDLKACRLKAFSTPESAKIAVTELLDKSDISKLPSYSLRELFDLVRDVLGWKSLVDFYNRLGDTDRKPVYFKEQTALAKSRLGQFIEATAEIEKLVEEYGRTIERCQLLGQFYRQQYYAEENNARKKRNLNTAINHYETGLYLDLNDYVCAQNLLLLYSLRNNDGDAEKARETAAHILRACDHKEAIQSSDKLIDAARLSVAFFRCDENAARELADKASQHDLSNWETSLFIELWESFVKTISDEQKETFNSIIDEFKSFVSIPQKELVTRIQPLLMSSGKDYEKFQTVKARIAIAGEKIVSVVSSGRETVNTAQTGDYVVENQTGAKEVYIAPKSKFESRYVFNKKLDSEWSLYKPIGKVRGVAVDHSILSLFGQQDSFYITAPWKEAQHVAEGDMFVTTLPMDEKLEVYRIAQKEFAETYRLINSTE